MAIFVRFIPPMALFRLYFSTNSYVAQGVSSHFTDTYQPNMKRIFCLKRIFSIVTLSSFLSFGAAAQSLDFAGLGQNAPVAVTPDASTGLTAVYVVDDLSRATVSYTATGGGRFAWQKYGSMGGGYAQDVTGMTRNGNTYTITPGSDDTGYIIDDGSRRFCFWVVNYANHALQLDGLSVDADNSDCNRTVLLVQGDGGPITFYTVNGRGVELSRDLSLEYRTLVYDESASQWQQASQATQLASVHNAVSVDAPLCDTEFTLSGDRFLSAWGARQSVSSPYVTATAVSAVVSAVQTEHEGADNESKPETSGGLGGSAPCQIVFTAAPTDAVVFKEWQFSKTEDFDDINARYAQDVLDYTFDEEGTVYVRFSVADASGACTFDSQVYTVSIGASKLECPNAFSPANQDGVNDLWKVSYTSIVQFECNIFNRWGTKMATLHHPSEGWDGRYKGKFVPSGVYFYVIKAVGADGRKYDKSGDINIINSRRDMQSSSDGGQAAE